MPSEAWFAHRGLESISQACDLAGSDVKGMACLGEEAAPLDDACFATYSKVAGVPSSAVADIQAPFKAIQTACSAITTKVLRAFSPAGTPAGTGTASRKKSLLYCLPWHC